MRGPKRGGGGLRDEGGRPKGEIEEGRRKEGRFAGRRSAGSFKPFLHLSRLPFALAQVTSIGIQMEGECDMAKLNEWLSKLLQERGVDLFRSKGILSIAGTNDKCVYELKCASSSAAWDLVGSGSMWRRR